MKEYLKHFKEDLPDWLKRYKPGDNVTFDMIMSSRIGYYPGSYLDGNLVAVANTSHCVHSFLYVDYMLDKERLCNELDRNSFRGYHSIGRIEWTEHDIMPEGQHPIIVNYRPRNPLRNFMHGNERTPYCFTEILERSAEYGDDWGAKRFAVTFLYADGIATYYQLFVKKYAKAQWRLLLQDHGFGGNYDKFGKGGLLDAIITQYNTRPEFVICAQNTSLWDGYKRVPGLKQTSGGMHYIPRFLYQKSNI